MMEGTSEDTPVTLQLETFQYIWENESLCALVKGSKVLMFSADVFIIQHTKKPPSSVILGKFKNNATADDITKVLQNVAPHHPTWMKLVSESIVEHSILQTVVRQLITVIGVEKLELNNVPLDFLPEEVSQLDELILDLSSNIKRIDVLRSIEDMVKELLMYMPMYGRMLWETDQLGEKERTLLRQAAGDDDDDDDDDERPRRFGSISTILGFLHQNSFEWLVLYFLLVDVKRILSKTEDLQFLKHHILEMMHYSRVDQSKLGNVSVEYIYSLLERDEGLPEAIMSDFVQKTLHSIRNDRQGLDSHVTNFSSNFTQLLYIRNKQTLNDLPDTAKKYVTKVLLSNNDDIVKILLQNIGDYLRLTILQVDHNKLEMIPDSIGNLSHLQKFDASSNKLKVLPPAFCRCTQLTYINIADNMIQALPLNIGNLVKVEHFDLQRNNLSCLPLTFDSIKSLRKPASKLLLKRNPLIHPPIEVCLQGIYGIHSYLKELRRSDAHNMNYQRLVLVGETMAGKTSLAQTLMANSSQLTRVEERTVVLEQHSWPAEGGLEIQINDFGGHEMYHLTSPCFFTPDAAHLLIFDVNKYTPQDHHKHIGSWLDIVRMKVPRATIRMVGTHIDECSPDEISEKLQYIADRVAKDEAKWKADITSQLDMIEHDSNECLGELGRQKRRECLQIQLKSLPNLHEPGSAVGIRTVSSSDFSGIDSLSSYIRDLCRQVGSNRRDTIPKIWFDLHEMLLSEDYDKQHFVHLNDLQLDFKELDEPEANIELHVADLMQNLEFESDDEFYMYDEESDIDEDTDDNTDEEMNVAKGTVETRSCIASCLEHNQETNAAGTHLSSKEEVNKNDANDHQPLPFPSDTAKSREETMCLAPVTSKRLVAALHYLKAVGLITWYPDEKLKHLIFHRPAKLVDIFKAIINHNIKNQLDYKDVVFSTVGQFSKQGFAIAVQEFESTANLSVAIVRCMWHKLGFSKEDTESLIKLMIKFDICYEVLHSEVAPGLEPSHRLHIPWYLSADPPKDLSKMWPQPPPDDYQQLTMQYHFPTFCPRGLFERTSVRLHRRIAQRVNWKNGVWAVVDSRQVLLTRSMTDDESGREEVFTLSVRAPVAEQQPGYTDDITPLWTTFLSIHRDMQNLIQEWPGLRCDTFLQCAHCVKMGKDPPNLFPGGVLEQQCQKDVRTIPCPQYPVAVPVQQVRADLVYPPKSCMEPITHHSDLARKTTDACAPNPVSDIDRRHQEMATRGKRKAPPEDLEDLIKRNYPLLRKRLQVSDLFPHLIQRGFLQIEEKEDISSRTTKQQKAEALLDLLSQQGKCTSDEFVDILRIGDHEHIVGQLK